MTRRSPQILLLAVAVLLSVFRASGHAEGEKDTFKPYKNKAGKLEILMPGTPKEESSVEKTVAGDITLWQASVILSTKAYFVSYSDMPKSTWKGDVKKMLEGARDGAAQRVKGKIVGDRVIKLAGKYPGREFKVAVDKMELTQRVYLVEHRLYQVNMGCLAGSCTDGEIQDYLNSFKLAK